MWQRINLRFAHINERQLQRLAIDLLSGGNVRQQEALRLQRRRAGIELPALVVAMVYLTGNQPGAHLWLR